MANLGNFALIVGLALAIFGTIASLIAAVRAKESFRQMAVRSYIGATLGILTAIVCLGYLLQVDDFSIVYVQTHSNVTLPTVFKFTAIWGGSQGSLLFWSLILSVYTWIFLVRTKKVPKLMLSWAMFFVGLSLVFFLTINNVVANPFATWSRHIGELPPVPVQPTDGTGLNPQLQHWAMIIHPPLLYTGYIGFLFPFALALGALITRMEGREWIRIIRRWTLTAWLILGIGIILGGAWAYMELGWGGYWAWDPVENASFMPWLLATAFIHSVMAQETRGMFKVWNMILIIGTFLMCMFGTFITRSGLISSVHAFAESDIGYYFIAYIIINAVASAIVMYARRDQLRDDNAYQSSTSREVSLLFNNVLFITICVTMLLATVYPMLTEAIYGTKRELRHGFYNTVEIPIFLGLMALMAVGPVLTWKKTSSRLIRERFVWPGVAMVIVFVVATALNHPVSWLQMENISFAVLTFLGLTIMQEFWIVVRRRMSRASENPFTALYSVIRLNKRRYGGYITHLSVLIMGIGITGAAFNKQAKEELSIGQTMQVGAYTFQVENLVGENTDNYFTFKGTVNLLEDGRVTRTFYPEQRFYHASQSQASEVSIGITPGRDYYVVLAGAGRGSTTEHPIGVFHVYVNPLVIWLWLGGLLMIVGTVIAMLPDGVRVPVAQRASIGMGEPA